MSKSAPRITDPNKGFRIHLDTQQHSELLPSFAQAHAGTPLQESLWYPNEPDLLDRETRVVKNLDDLLALMQSGAHERLAESVVLMGSAKPIPWKEFFIRETRPDGMQRFADLYNRVGKIKGGDPVPCAILIEIAEDKTLRHFGQKWVKGKGIKVDGRDIEFELRLSYLEQNNLADVYMRKGQLLLVTGMAERSFAGHSRETVRIYVDHPEAMRLVTRKELTTPPEPYKPGPPRPITVEEMGSLDW